MTDDCEFDTAVCPVCEQEIAKVSVKMLRAENSRVAKKFWTCTACDAILGPTA